MGIVMQKHHHSTCFTMPQRLLPFSKSKEHLSGTRYSSNSDVKTVAENWLNRQERDFYQAGLKKLALRSDKCLDRFGDYVKGDQQVCLLILF
ncbi:hypothetical protein AVEN_81512-1 [Araneus ventricosus]|uniref:Uncharacterized protein n=1 Tax=Araneus ventricosus TaxID=182803 RepID=A0A4Y2SFD8_ARAVE|nr:hypothetical protein AVEN_81512-1 [Araneus ventricosus]